MIKICNNFVHLLVLFSQDACRKPQQVCGHNGETYNTVCDAFSDRVAVDYEGPCHAVGAVSDVASDTACSVIPCPPLSTAGCWPVTPPGECTALRKPLSDSIELQKDSEYLCNKCQIDFEGSFLMICTQR